jgi:hypothetical protein
MNKLSEKEFATLVMELGPDATEEQILAEAKKREQSLAGKVWDKLVTPLTDAPSRLGKAIGDKVDQRTLDESRFEAMNKGMLAGMAEGAGNVVSSLTSPLDLALTALGLGGASAAKRGFTGVARAARAGEMALQAPLVAKGAHDVTTGAAQGDLAKVGSGGVLALLGAAGMKASAKAPVSTMPGARSVLPQDANLGSLPLPKPVDRSGQYRPGGTGFRSTAHLYPKGAARELLHAHDGTQALKTELFEQAHPNYPGASTPATAPTPAPPSTGTVAASPSLDLVGASKQAFDLHAQHGGATFNLHKGSLAGTPHYAVAKFPERTQIIDGDLTPEMLQDYVQRNADVLSDPLHSIGTWKNAENGKTYLDVTETLDDLAAATESGTRRGELAIFDLQKMQEIPLPAAAKSSGPVAPGLPESAAQTPQPLPVSGAIEASLPSPHSTMAEPMVRFEHRSLQEGLSELDPSFYGKGSAGAEARRKANYGDTWVDRTYATRAGGKFEPRFDKHHVYEGEVPESALYDLLDDPQGLLPKALEASGGDKQGAITLYERLIKDAGFKGFRAAKHEDPTMADTIVLFEKTPVTRRAAAQADPAQTSSVALPRAVGSEGSVPPVGAVGAPGRQTTGLVNSAEGPKASSAQDNTLPMDDASRMQRAQEMGFDTARTQWHGTEAKNNIEEFRVFNPNGGLQVLDMNMETPRSGAFFSADKDYAGKFGSKVEPYLTRLENVADVDLDRGGYPAAIVNEFRESLDANGPDRDIWAHVRYAREPWMLFDGEAGKRFVEFLRTKGFDGARFREGDNDALTTVVLDPTKIRHRDKAAFDPAKSNSANVLASVAAPSAAMAIPDDPNSNWDEVARAGLMAGGAAGLGMAFRGRGSKGNKVSTNPQGSRRERLLAIALDARQKGGSQADALASLQREVPYLKPTDPTTVRILRQADELYKQGRTSPEEIAASRGQVHAPRPTAEIAPFTS